MSTIQAAVPPAPTFAVHGEAKQQAMRTMKSRSEKRAWPLLLAIISVVAAFLFSQNEARAAITVAQVTRTVTTTGASTQATAAFTPVANTLYLMWTIQTIGTGPPTVPTATCANGLAMVQVNTVTFATTATQLNRLTLFRAMKPSGLVNGACTITWGQTTTGHGHVIVGFTGVDTSETDGSGAVVQSVTGRTDSATAAAGLSITLAALQAGSTTAGGFSNAVNNASSLTAGGGYTAGTGGAFNTPATSIRAEWNTTGSTTVNMTQSTTSDIGGIAVEVAPVVSAANSTVSASPSSVIADGISTSTITVTLKNRAGTGVAGKTVTLAKSGGSSIISAASGVSSAGGVVTFTVTDTVAEGPITYTATDTTDAIVVTQTAPVTFTANVPSAALSTVTRSPPSVIADGISLSTITVTLLNANGNPVPNKTVTLGQAGGASTISAASGVSSAGGVVTFTVKDSTVETVTYTATDTTDAVTVTQTAAVIFTANVPSAALSTVVANPTSVLADNSTTSTITVTLKNAAGNAVPGKTVTLAANSGSSVFVSAPSGVSDSSGVVTFTIKDAVIEGPITYTATDTTDPIVITQTAQVTFTDPLCFVDDFNRASLLSSSNWTRTKSTGTPFDADIVNNRLRLTDAGPGEATAVHLSRLFPGFGNKVVAEFNYYAYNGNGADGIAITLSDAATPPAAGAFGGSLGYAQKTGIPGFAGGWIGIGLDEYGNYSNPSEGRVDGPGARSDAVTIRGSGSVQTGYNFHAYSGSAVLTPGIDSTVAQTPPAAAPGDRYRVTVDHSDSVHAYVTVERDTGSGYGILIPTYDAKAIPSQAAVPTDWLFSFTGSTGASTNIHEIDNLRVCTAQPPVIPVLDHVRIIHDGSALTCADKTITLKACANAACSALYTGNVTVDLATISGATWSTDPITFSGGQVEVTLAKATNGTVTLGGNVTAPSSMAAVCYNGSTSGDCSLTYSSSACAFDAVEPGQAPGTPIFTKLAGTAFTVDVLALNAGVINTGFTSQVTVGLVDQTGVAEGTCGSTVLANPTTPTSPYTFTSGNAGRRTFTFNYANAARDVRVRIVRVSSGLTACSSDNFAIRPTSFSVSSPNAGNAATTGTPIFKAGTDAFELDAASVTGYTGTARINNNRIEAHVAIPAATPGLVGGTFSPATLASSWVSKGTAFTYSEVGNFRFIPWGVYDDGSFADVDRGKVPPECFIDNRVGTVIDPANPNVKDGNLKYGCYFGTTSTSSYFGRFIPDHFDTVATGPMTCTGLTFTTACPAGGLAYSGQPFSVQVTARNAGGNPTQNYQGNFAKDVTLSAVTAGGGVAIPTLAPGGTLSANSAAASSFGGGSNAGTLAKPVFTFGTTPTTPTDVFVRAIDADSVSSLLPSASSSIEGGVKVVSGRIRIPNMYGSEQLKLPLTATVQYYNGTYWLTSATDNVTTISASDFALAFPVATGNNLSACETSVSITGSSPSFTMNLSKPGTGNNGWTDLTLNLGAAAGSGCVGGVGATSTTANRPWLQYPWTGSAAADPRARATFGIYKSPLIYRRENY